MMVRQLSRYVAVGVLNTAVGLSMIYLAQFALRLDPLKANAVGFFAGLLISFLLNRRWTFQNKTNIYQDILPFLTIFLLSYGANLFLLWILVKKNYVNAYIAQIGAVVFYSILMFIGLQAWSRIGPAFVAESENLAGKLNAFIVLIDAAIGRFFSFFLISIFGFFFAIGFVLFSNYGDKVDYYQDQFAPAVIYACGLKLDNVYGIGEGTPFYEFLHKKREDLDCVDILDGTKLRRPMNTGELNIHQNQTFGFLYFFGNVWKFTGITWSVAPYLAGLLLGLTVAAFALLNRFFLPPLLALGLPAGLFLLDKPQYAYFSQLRDFSKAPFAYCLIVLTLLTWKQTGKAIIPVACLAALTLALSLGFRPDSSNFLWLFAIILLTKALFFKAERLVSLLALVCYLITLELFRIFAYDWTLGLGRNFFHFFFLGLAETFRSSLGLFPADFDYSYIYNDSVAYEYTGLFVKAQGLEIPNYGSPQYDKMGSLEFLTYALHFPADLTVRALSAWPMVLFGWLSRDAVLQLAVTVFTYSLFVWARGGLGIVFLLVVTFLAGITSVQFDPRHFFLYKAIGILLLAAAVEPVARQLLFAVESSAGIATPQDLMRRTRAGAVALLAGFPVSNRLFAAAVPVLAVLTFLLVVPLLRLYQARDVRQVIERLDRAETLVVIKSDRLAAFDAEELRQALEQDHRQYARLIVDQSESGCFYHPRLRLNYWAKRRFDDWSADVRLTAEHLKQIYLPLVDEKDYNRLMEISIGDSSTCVARLELIRLPEKIIPQFYYVEREPKAQRLWSLGAAERQFWGWFDKSYRATIRRNEYESPL